MSAPRPCICERPWLDAAWHCERCGHDRPVPGLNEVLATAGRLGVPWTPDEARSDVLRHGPAKAVLRVVGEHQRRVQAVAELPPICERPDPHAEAQWVWAAPLVDWLKERGLYDGLREHEFAEARLKKWHHRAERATIVSVDKVLTLAGVHLSELPPELFVLPSDAQLLPADEPERAAA